VISQEVKNQIIAEVLGSGMGNIDLENLGISLGLTGDDIDLQVGIIAEEGGVWRCETCDWWVEEDELQNDVCSDCYSKDNDE